MSLTFHFVGKYVLSMDVRIHNGSVWMGWVHTDIRKAWGGQPPEPQMGHRCPHGAWGRLQGLGEGMELGKRDVLNYI